MHWACKAVDPMPSTIGTRLEFAIEAIKTYGYCEEADHPYRASAAKGSSAPPPPHVVANAALNRTSDCQRWKSRSLDELIDLIDVHGCVAVSLRVFTDARSTTGYSNWYNAYSRLTGHVQEAPTGGSLRTYGHSVVLVGYHDDLLAPGGGFFVFRNCWKDWGKGPSVRGNVIKSGYGTVSAQYVFDHLLEAAVVRSRDPGAHHDPYNT
jgi:hypothetical protein